MQYRLFTEEFLTALGGSGKRKPAVGDARRGRERLDAS